MSVHVKISRSKDFDNEFIKDFVAIATVAKFHVKKVPKTLVFM